MFGRCRNADIYERLYPLGEGTYGKVFKARHKETNEIVALKKIIIASDIFPETFLREIRTLLSIEHPNIVRLKEIVLETPTTAHNILDKKRLSNQNITSQRPLKQAKHQDVSETTSTSSNFHEKQKTNIPSIFNQSLNPRRDHSKYYQKNMIEEQDSYLVSNEQEEEEVTCKTPTSSCATYLVFEYCNRDLFALQQQFGTTWSMPRAEVKCIMQQLLRGLDCLHQNFIIHRDIKLPNLFLTHKGELKIGDLGLAREYEHPSSILTPDLVTLWYRAPELFFGLKNYTTAVDIWAAGCVMGELLLGAPLLPGSNDADQMNLICNLVGVPTSKIWPDIEKLPSFYKYSLPMNPYNNLVLKFPNETPACRDLLSRLLICDPSKRITAREALQHPYFAESPLPNMLLMKHYEMGSNEMILQQRTKVIPRGDAVAVHDLLKALGDNRGTSIFGTKK